MITISVVLILQRYQMEYHVCCGVGNTYKHSKKGVTFLYSWLNHFAFQESVRKAADLTLKTLSKVKLFVTALACVYYVYVYVWLPIPVCPGVHPYVWVNRLCSPENCGSDVAHPVGERHREQCARGPFIKVMTSKSKANHIWPSCWIFLFSHYKILTDTYEILGKDASSFTFEPLFW